VIRSAVFDSDDDGGGVVGAGAEACELADFPVKEFEDSLFEGVMEALKHEPAEKVATPEAGPKLAVLSGGKGSRDRTSQFKKPVRIPTLIDLAKARESRKNRMDNSPRDLA
jgi:hypothetical protein